MWEARCYAGVHCTGFVSFQCEVVNVEGSGAHHCISNCSFTKYPIVSPVKGTRIIPKVVINSKLLKNMVVL